MLLIIYIAIGLIIGPSSLNLPGNELLFGLCAQGFLLVAGLELSLKHLKTHLPAAAKIALGAFAVPFLVGLLAAPFISENTSSAVIIALALSISALPVIVQILKDLKIYDTKVGHLIVSAATICDILAWAIFLCVIPAENRHTWIKSHWPILFFFVGIGISGWVHRFPNLLAGLLKVSQWLFAPVFFISVGMKIHFQENFSWEQFLFVLALAIFSKVVGVYGVARWAKHTKSDSFLMAVVLNARGAMEVLYASLALSLGMINETLFTSLVLMAVVSSIMAAPAARHWRSV
ncbi:MAG: cation:proton antiporter [Bdellovibrionaceae bacterium]|nr:cation:proton antiporter [Pseudobdellovibrionaceae bacterium]